MSFLKPKVALVLGGGGARGMTQLGVIKVLEAEGIRPDLIVGCSAGALIGSLYAFSCDIEEAEKKLVTFTESSEIDIDSFKNLEMMTPLKDEKKGFFHRLKRIYKTGRFLARTALKPSYIETREFDHNVGGLLPDAMIEDANIPMVIVATALKDGAEKIFRSGPLRDAVKASSAISGVFPPVEIGGELLVDGGFVDKVPVEIALRLGADVVIAVDVSREIEDTRDFELHGTAITGRAESILSATLKRVQTRFADVLIRPEVESLHWADFTASRRAIELGEQAASEKLAEIHRAIRAGRWRRLKRLFFRVQRRKYRFEPID